MITTVNNESKNVVVAFHIGRGGRFNNAGHKSFMSNANSLQDLIRLNDLTIVNEDYNDDANKFVQLADEDWMLIDDAGNVILEGRDYIENEVGVLEMDTIYDTDIAKYIEDCTDEEMEILYQAYLDGEISDDDAINYVCDWKGVKRISSVKFYKTNATIFFTDHTSLEYYWDGEEDVEEDEIKEWMADENIDEISIEKNYNDFVSHFYND